MHPKLSWIELLGVMLSEVLGTSIVATPRDHVDPLKKIVVLEMGSVLSKGNYNPLQSMIHTYAKANDCAVSAIRREGPKKLILEVLIKRRISEKMRNDPFQSDKTEPSKET